jgi:pentose-5-phosphate-3-epimerase
MQISPAILTTNQQKIVELLNSYVKSGFTTIDIDIQQTPFASSTTVNWPEVLKILANFDLPTTVSIGWDLKIAQPLDAVQQILAQAKKLKHSYRIYIYSTASIQPMLDLNLDLAANHIGLGILGNKTMRGIEFMQQFPEVQLMTVAEEQQGSKFDPNLLDRVTQIREMGYTGQVSIDGGVNLESAELINAYAKEVEINRVSVGSYFQESQELLLDLQKLQLALNI